MDPKLLDRDMTPINPYSIFEEWWGEPMSREMIRRAVRAPKAQQIEFLRFARAYAGTTLPELKAGLLRPLATFDPLLTDGRNLDAYYSSTLSLLLYAHEAVIEYSFGYPIEPGLREFRLVLPRLLGLKPLSDAGVIHFLRVHWSKAYHPSRAGLHLYGLDDSDYPPNAWERFASSVEALDVLDETYTYDTALFHFQTFTGVALNLKTRWPDHLQVLARCDAEQVLLQAATRRASRSFADMRQVHLSKLNALAMPNYSLTIPGLVAVRKDNEFFAAWRDGVQRAVSQVGELSEGDDTWLREARQIISGELMPLREQLMQKAKRSAVLTEARHGLRSLVLSGVGASAGALAGGDLASGVVGAAVGPVGDLLTQYMRAVRERRRARAILDLVVQFSHQHD